MSRGRWAFDTPDDWLRWTMRRRLARIRAALRELGEAP